MFTSTRLLILLAFPVIVEIGLPQEIQSTGVHSAPPVIESVEPTVATPWSYVMISGQNLAKADGTCSVRISELSSYAADCSPTTIRAVVPWAAATGAVVVSADGAASNPVQLAVIPLQLDSTKI